MGVAGGRRASGPWRRPGDARDASGGPEAAPGPRQRRRLHPRRPRPLLRHLRPRPPIRRAPRRPDRSYPSPLRFLLAPTLPARGTWRVAVRRVGVWRRPVAGVALCCPAADGELWPLGSRPNEPYFGLGGPARHCWYQSGGGSLRGPRWDLPPAGILAE